MRCANPESIPRHVVDAATYAYRDAKESRSDYNNAMPRAIAAALTALMDDEPVTVAQPVSQRLAFVRPSDVLAAVLARSTS